MDPQAEIYIQNLVNQYYCDLSSNRQAIAGKYYDPQARMTYQDAFIQGSQGIHEKLCTLAFQNLQISVTGINIQPVMDGKYIVFVYGQLRDGVDNPMPYSDIFLFASDGQQLRLFNHIFKITTQA